MLDLNSPISQVFININGDEILAVIVFVYILGCIFTDNTAKVHMTDEPVPYLFSIIRVVENRGPLLKFLIIRGIL